MNRLVTGLGVVGMVAASAACGQPFAFVSPTSSSSGTGGASGEGGGDGASSSGTPACAPGMSGACPEGRYCAGDTFTCEPCADLGRLHFHTPFAADLAPPTAGTTVFYPRLGDDPGALYFTYVDKSTPIPRRRIATAPLKTSGLGWGTWSFAPTPINSSGEESGALFLPDGSAIAPLVDPAIIDAGKPVLLFDSNRNGAATIAMFAANVEGSAAVPLLLPAGTRDGDIAVAALASPPRFFWRSDAGSTLGPRLVTTIAASPVAEEVPIPLDNGCVTSFVDAPWVTPDGSVLFFAAAYPAPPACAPPGVGPKHVFAVRLLDTGVPAPGETAHRLFPDDVMSYDSTPALTPDRCHLLFSRFDAAANGRLHGAMRD